MDYGRIPGTLVAITGSCTQKIIQACRQNLNFSVKYRGFILSHFNRVARVEDEVLDEVLDIWHAKILP